MYAELHCLSNFSFQRGASSAAELFERAKKLGYRALAITDECSLAGIVRALEASEATGVALIIGSELRLHDGLKLVLLCASRRGYETLCRAITVARRAASKGEYQLQRGDLEQALMHGAPGDGLLALWVPPADPSLWDEQTAWVARSFPACAWIAVELHRAADDGDRLAALHALAVRQQLPLAAAGDVQMHVRRRRALHDVLTAIRLNTPVAQAGHALFANGERHLRSTLALATLYPRDLLDESVRIAERCCFSLRQLHYEHPSELVPNGRTPSQHLRALTEAGAHERWPAGVAESVQAQIEKELALIAELRYEAFFLTVHDIVRYARSRGILCQGRGSAANSVVCYCLGITAVGPDRIHMLFERFISKERNEPPDIDVDFEHERREEVIQYIYRKYGRERAALAATVICYRARSAARDLARVLGFSSDQIEQLALVFAHGQSDVPLCERLRERGFDPDTPTLQRFAVLLQELRGFPRHLSQHVGGFIISGAPLWTLVPVENAAMPERTIIQWDKNDLDTLGLLKVDCLALGMLSCIRRCFALIARHRAIRHSLASIPGDDAATWAMIQRADTVGVFQIESRAQMSMLPRLKPANFYDLVIEVAIMRPGPIQGNMVHPFLRRRQGLEPVSFPSPELERVLGRTMGVPIFQEQVMHLAIVAAGYSAGEADQLRRSMAAWQRHGGLEPHRQRLLDGMAARGYHAEFAQQIFEQIKGFASYGFPESHAASFALLAWVSSWLKCHEPAAYACALLNAQPMGFYAPAQIVSDARQHGVTVRPLDVLASDWDCTLETCNDGFALRLGLRQLRGFDQASAERLMAARAQRPFLDVEDMVARAGLDKPAREALARGNALRRLAGHRHRAFWAAAGALPAPPVLRGARTEESQPCLPLPSVASDVFADYASTGLSLNRHPLSLIRQQLRARRIASARELDHADPGSYVRHAGLVTMRQRPQTASGVTFLTCEDETGLINVIVWHDLALKQRRELLDASVLGVDGVLERKDGVQHLIARRLHNLDDLLAGLDARSRDFR
ncbi:MAG: error-prone DNA polymerase [Lysobacterales bacterium CG17_big_fil_post_rev_8_21_14_2_50_64_11]|nr:MAG: error-prone DNA polymerase [Xanthomonadales bacterium CG17_big_fil_post_rev_8_21_14_2_50_64_11]PIX59972.1 MAG: error-prone DNA polymerase [Xanthomonadales bacterium CG_4_10_14_3_um_filter_64_11]